MLSLIHRGEKADLVAEEAKWEEAGNLAVGVHIGAGQVVGEEILDLVVFREEIPKKILEEEIPEKIEINVVKMDLGEVVEIQERELVGRIGSKKIFNRSYNHNDWDGLYLWNDLKMLNRL